MRGRSVDDRWLIRTIAVLGAAALLGACEDKPAPEPPQGRNAAVAATGKVEAPPASAGPAASATPPKPRRKLCGGQLISGKAVSDDTISGAAAKGAKPPPAKLEVGGGKWTWINFWAAWCVPCKEEIPRLRSWADKLASGGKFRLVFVSLDDDQRQLSQFLDAEPEGGMRQTLWLKEGEERETWLTSVGMDTDPSLPAHILLDPEGKVRCMFNGAVEDEDFSQLVSLMK